MKADTLGIVVLTVLALVFWHVGRQQYGIVQQQKQTIQELESQLDMKDDMIWLMKFHCAE